MRHMGVWGSLTGVWPVSSIFLALFLLAGCSDESGISPQEQVNLLLDHAEEVVEARDLEAAAELISSRYQDKSGRNRQQLRRLLAGYFLRHRSIHILKKTEQISLLNETNAQVVLYAGLAGPKALATDSFSQWSGDLIRLEVDLAFEDDGEWRLIRAEWRRASRGDF